MNPNARTLRQSLHRLLFLAVVLAASFLQAPVQAQERSAITLLVGFPAGGGVDLAARVLAEKLTLLLKRPVVVDNRPGAGGQIAARLLKAAPADGSVLFISNSHTLATVPQTVRNSGFDPMTDFRPVSNFTNFETILVANGQLGLKTIPDLRRWAGAQSGLSIGVPAPASVPEFIVSAIGKTWNVKVQAVPYRGAAPLANDLIAGQVPVGILTTLEAITFGKTGKLTVLAASHHTPLLPGVASFEEVGLKGLALTDFIAVYAPAAVLDSVIARYTTAIHEIAAMPDVVEKLKQAGQDAAVDTPEQQMVRLREATRIAGELMLSSGFKPE